MLLNQNNKGFENFHLLVRDLINNFHLTLIPLNIIVHVQFNKFNFNYKLNCFQERALLNLVLILLKIQAKKDPQYINYLKIIQLVNSNYLVFSIFNQTHRIKLSFNCILLFKKHNFHHIQQKFILNFLKF